MFEAVSSVYASIASWVTPSCLFLFINLVIGTIAVSSRFASNQRKQQQQQQQQQRVDSPGQLARSPSLLDRVMSFNLGGYHKYQPPAEPESVPDPLQNQIPDSPRLARAPSLLDRVKSINLGLLKTEEREDPKQDDPTQQELTRTPSLLERLKSMQFYRTGSVVKDEKEEHGSESEPEASGIGLGQVNSVEGRGRFSRKWEGEEGEEEVDKKADDFINRFKQQLRLQRLESILRYREEKKRKDC